MKAAPYIIVGVVLASIVTGYIFLKSPDDGGTSSSAQLVSGDLGDQTNGDSVRTENGIQIVHIVAGGGYSPRKVTVKADIATQIEMETNGTYDCSSALTIPAIKYNKQLPATGTTLIDIPAQSKSTVLTGLCAMGMFRFDIEFV